MNRCGRLSIAAVFCSLAAIGRADERRVSGTVWSGDLPAPGAIVFLQSGYDDLTTTATSSADGRFELQLISSNFLGQAMLWAEAPHGKLSELVAARDKERYDLLLGEPARIEGIVADEAGKPVGGAEVSAAPAILSGFKRAATSKPDGSYSIAVPAHASGYWIYAETADFFLPTDMPGFEPSVRPAAGKTAKKDLRLAPFGKLRGKVVGPDGLPAAGVEVSVNVDGGGDFGRERPPAVSAADGGFELSVKQSQREVALRASSEKIGVRKVLAVAPKPGEARDGIVIDMPGSVRIEARVVDTYGRPVQGVRVIVKQGGAGLSSSYSAQSILVDSEEEIDKAADNYTRNPEGPNVTGIDGACVLPSVSLERAWNGSPLAIRFEPMRPLPPVFVLSRQPVSDPSQPMRRKILGVLQPELDPQEVFWQGRELIRDARPGQTIKIEVVLQPTELLVFRGVLADPAGAPVPKATVALFAGDGGREWRRSFEPFSLLYGGYSVSSAGERAVLLAAALTGPKGEFTLRAVRESPDALAAIGIDSRNPNRFAIGAVAPDGGSQLFTGIDMAEGERVRNIALEFDPATGAK